jgi:DNA-binding transcriptional ArsR family regulator
MAADAHDLLRALAEPQRRRVLELIGQDERASGEIAEHFDISPQAVSQHLKVLREAGLLRERRSGTRRLYAVRPEAVDDVRAYLDRLWPASLARLKDVVERDQRAGKRRAHG